MKPFLFCPACAAELGEPDFEGGALCPGCGRSWYRNMSPTVGVALVRAGRVLVTVRAKDPAKGKVDVAGGFLRIGETPPDGLTREVREELGLDVGVTMEDCVQIVPHQYGAEGEWVLSIGFAARAPEGEPRPADDVASVRWIEEAELGDVDFAWPHDRDLVRAALNRQG